jgi:(p)ppGpp synthase/HD superfamily hydrolase
MKSMLGTAIAIAATCHVEQTDRGGKAYILHPLRMMMRLRTDDEELMCIAVLHDCVEDCGIITPDDLRDAGMTERVIAGVISLSRNDDETYEEFIERCGKNPDGVLVKLEDLRDNSDITRLKGLRQKDHDRIAKYSKAYVYLSGLK